jgi:hypothetical protein
MSTHSDNSPEAVWKDFAPVAPDAAPVIVNTKTEPQIRKRGGCQFCRSRKFLRSGVRGADIAAILLLHYPVRCLRCRQRQFTDFLTASMALNAGSQIYNGSKKRGDWRSWTSGSDRTVVEAWDQMSANRQSEIQGDTP